MSKQNKVININQLSFHFPNKVGILCGDLFEPVMMFFASICNIPVQYILPVLAYWWMRWQEPAKLSWYDYGKLFLHACCFASGCFFMVLGTIESVEAMVTQIHLFNNYYQIPLWSNYNTIISDSLKYSQYVNIFRNAPLKQHQDYASILIQGAREIFFWVFNNNMLNFVSSFQNITINSHNNNNLTKNNFSKSFQVEM